jgi:hypothetical protein
VKSVVFASELSFSFAFELAFPMVVLGIICSVFEYFLRAIFICMLANIMNKEQADKDVKDCCSSLKRQLVTAQDERHEAARIGNHLLSELSAVKAKVTSQTQNLKLHGAGALVIIGLICAVEADLLNKMRESAIQIKSLKAQLQTSDAQLYDWYSLLFIAYSIQSIGITNSQTINRGNSKTIIQTGRIQQTTLVYSILPKYTNGSIKDGKGFVGIKAGRGSCDCLDTARRDQEP